MNNYIIRKKMVCRCKMCWKIARKYLYLYPVKKRMQILYFLSFLFENCHYFYKN
jgi:hypothetical protein